MTNIVSNKRVIGDYQMFIIIYDVIRQKDIRAHAIQTPLSTEIRTKEV